MPSEFPSLFWFWWRCFVAMAEGWYLLCIFPSSRSLFSTFIMANKAWMLQRCYLASSIAFTLVFGICFASESEKQLSCEANEINNSILNINASKRKLGSAVEVLQGLELQNKQECKSKCCENPNCTVYISYDRPVGYNCFLVSCNPQDACVYRTLNGSVVGFRTVSEGM